ncbi:MAG: ethanolamine ammonia-lyase subunit EutC [Alkaliphilus sp.]|nr:ethanolamine ammonia-lyase subunit EutC [Alkaliphilus sp.]
MTEKDLKKVIEQVLLELNQATKPNKGIDENKVSAFSGSKILEDEMLHDITAVDLKQQVLVPNPENLTALLKMKATTPARIGVWRAGPRYMTETLLRFRADHAVAMDAVFTHVSEEFLKEMNLFSIKTKCVSKDQYLTRPDLGRKFDEEELDVIRKQCIKKPQVQVYISDGLSSTAIEANIRDILPAIMQGLEGYKVKVGTPFFVKYGRVPAMDVISETLEADVTCVLIGERPGLATGESMSAYMAYGARVNMPEARRTVVSNIHKGGTPAVEAGAHIAHILNMMLEKKASGLELKL